MVVAPTLSATLASLGPTWPTDSPSADIGLTDPVFKKRMAAAGIDPKKQPEEAGAMWIDNVGTVEHGAGRRFRG